MKIKRLPQAPDSVAMLVQVVKIEDEEEEKIPGETIITSGTYALDSQGRIWALQEDLTLLFGGFKNK